MRSTVAILGSISMLFVGVIAVSHAGSNAETVAKNASNQTYNAFNASEAVFEGIGIAASPAIVYGGIAAIIMLALGFLVYAGGSGR